MGLAPTADELGYFDHKIWVQLVSSQVFFLVVGEGEGCFFHYCSGGREVQLVYLPIDTSAAHCCAHIARSGWMVFKFWQMASAGPASLQSILLVALRMHGREQVSGLRTPSVLTRPRIKSNAVADTGVTAPTRRMTLDAFIVITGVYFRIKI